MPDILNFECKNWELNVWTRNNRAPRELLSAVLRERGSKLSSQKVCLSFRLTGDENLEFEEESLEVTPDSSQFSIPTPLCYENRDYEFEFRYKNGCTLDREHPVIHRLIEVENGFRTVGSKGIRGIVNFKNNIGWFKLGLRYSYDGKTRSDYISFKVFPTKMDMETDIDTISQVIDEIYPLWRFCLTSKTDSLLSRSNKNHVSFELLWIAQFKSLAVDLASAGRLICRSPHSRLLPDVKKLKIERITGRLSGRLEERIKENLIEKQHEKRYRIEKKKLSYDTPENRFVKMVLSHSLMRLKLFFNRVKDLEKTPENARLSKSFYEELNELVAPFEKLSSEPLFREVGNYEGHMRESLVLYRRAGYTKTYRIWQELKLYLDYLGSDASVSVRSVEQLYEIWCLLEIRRLLMTLGFKEGKDPKRTLKTIGYEKHMRKKDETFFLHRSDGMKALLIHEPTYSGPKNKDFDRIYSWTTTQRPDIFLEVTMPLGDKLRWVFDAKYRIDANEDKSWPCKGIDTVPDDSINQMHRYRDSLIYISEADEDGETDKSRPIIGAFALYPGWFEDQSDTTNPYNDSIDAVGIGAFPLLPGQDNFWLAEFLKSQLGDGGTEYDVKEADELYLQEPVRIAPYGMKQYRYKELLLAVSIYKTSPPSYYRPFESGTAQYYHMPVKTSDRCKISRYVMRELAYCAFSVLDDGGRMCRHVYPVQALTRMKRHEIDDIAGGPTSRNPDADYWVIKLGASIEITPIKADRDRHFKTRIVDFNTFRLIDRWEDIPAQRYKNSFH